MMADEVENAAPTFKKRSKLTTKRKRDSSGSSVEESEEPSQHLSVAEILRQRKHGKIRRSTLTTPHHGSASDTQEAVAGVKAKDESEIDRMRNRFVAQTGQVVGLYDKQMNEYIDAKMAEYRDQQPGNPTTHPPTSHQKQSPAPDLITRNGANAKPDKLSVTAGKLMEVDLGGSLSRHEEEAAAKAAKPVKVRLGRDGKPWRPRKRRGSDDLARDALIDSIMKENTLPRFQDGAPIASTGKTPATPSNDYVDEDRVLENFKSNYQDPERRNARKPPTKDKQDQAKGPKMGGSKNARRAAEEAAKAKKP